MRQHLAATIGSIIGGSPIVAALIAAIIAWTISGGDEQAFAGLGYNPLLQPAFALAIAAPWLLGGSLDLFSRFR